MPCILSPESKAELDELQSLLADRGTLSSLIVKLNPLLYTERGTRAGEWRKTPKHLPVQGECSTVALGILASVKNDTE